MTPISALLLHLSISFLHLASSTDNTNSPCSSLNTGGVDSSSRVHRCVTAAAAAQRRSVAVVMPNGTCLLCGTSKKVGDQCASYRSVGKAGGRMLLLRTNAAGAVTPYNLLMSGPSNDSIAAEVGPTLAGVQSYRSPLLDVVHEMGVSKVELQLLSGDGSVVVRLGFSLAGRLQEGSNWFSKEHLVSAFPWSLEKMKKENYNYFTLHQWHRLAVRTFFINVNYGGCAVDEGYLCISEKVVCPWETSRKFSKPYIWTADGTNWERKGQEAEEFQLWAVMSDVMVFAAP